MAKQLDSDHTLTGICSYLFILVLIPLLVVKKRDEFIKFHLSQGLTLFIVELAAAVSFSILASLPIVGAAFGVVHSIVWAAFLIVSIIAIVKALSGEMWKIPYMDFRFVHLK